MNTSIDLSTIFLKRQAESRSLSAENYRGEKGAGGMATKETSLTPGAWEQAVHFVRGWKISPCLPLKSG